MEYSPVNQTSDYSVQLGIDHAIWHSSDFPDEVTISKSMYDILSKLGILDNNVRNSNVGSSDYSKHIIQPWSIWIDYNLNPWDADIVKRVLRTKKEADKTEDEARIQDYQKIIHICNERIRQLSHGK